MTDEEGKRDGGTALPEVVAAQKAGDLDRLMRGEQPDTTFLEDAEHWVGVYSELLAFKRDLMDFTKGRIAAMQAAAGNELATTDLVMMEAEYGRLRSRFDFWQNRRRELDS